MFASITLQKPFSPQKAVHLGQANLDMQDVYELQVSLKERIREFLKDQALFPRELIFISRNMNIVRANNKTLGSPVNRINVMARWALHGLSRQPTTNASLRGSIDRTIQFERVAQATWRLWVFDLTLMLMSLSFWLVQMRDRLDRALFGKKGQGFEEVLDQRLKDQVSPTHDRSSPILIHRK